MSSAIRSRIKRDQDEQPLAFRYDIKPNPRINVFVPKALTTSFEMMDMRATMFGSAALGHFNSLPRSADAGIYWEALVFLMCRLLEGYEAGT